MRKGERCYKRESVVERKEMNVSVSRATYEWVERAAKSRAISKSALVEDILLDGLPEEFQNEV
jgi:hypothetical protein